MAARAKVAILKTSPATVLADYHRLMNLAGYQAPWAYIASVIYHDSFWYPLKAKRMMHDVLDSVWGRLFRHWDVVNADERGYPSIPDEGAELTRTGLRALWRSFGILATCVKEAPEFGARRRRSKHG